MLGRCIVTDWTPRPAQPYEPGNSAAVRHGAFSEQIVAERANEIRDRFIELAPWLARPAFAESLYRYTRAVAREVLLDNYITEMAETTGVGSISSRVFEQCTAAARLSHKLAGDLGLTPIGEAKLRALVGNAATTEATLATLMAAGRATRAGRQQAAVAHQTPQDGPQGHEPDAVDDDTRGAS
jgi:hypothetical protein